MCGCWCGCVHAGVCVRNRGACQFDDDKLVNHKVTLWSPFHHPEGEMDSLHSLGLLQKCVSVD